MPVITSVVMIRPHQVRAQFHRRTIAGAVSVEFTNHLVLQIAVGGGLVGLGFNAKQMVGELRAEDSSAPPDGAPACLRRPRNRRVWLVSVTVIMRTPLSLMDSSASCHSG
jgi:hypothetical protein